MKAMISKSLNILNSSLYVVSASSVIGLNFRFFWRKVSEFGCSVSSMVRGRMSGCCLCEEELRES